MKTVFFIFINLISFQVAKSQEWKIYSKKDGLIDEYVNAIFIDSSNIKWFATSKGITKFDSINWTSYSIPDSSVNSSVIEIFKEPTPTKEIYAINKDAKGNMWFGTNKGVSMFDGNKWTTYTTSNSGIVNNTVYAIAIDAKDNKWFGTNEGVSKFDSTHWTNYSKKNGLVNNTVHTIAIDAHGNKWFGTYSGVSKFDGFHWTSYTKSNSGLDGVYSIATDTLGNLWFASRDENGGIISKFDGKNWTFFSTKNESTPNNINAIAFDNKGNLWAGLGGGGEDGGVLEFNGTNWIYYNAENSWLDYASVRAIAIDAQGNKWFGTWGSGIKKYTKE